MASRNRPRERPTGLRRFLKIYAFDPMLGKTSGNRVTLDVLNEPVLPGPCGARIKVVDYDGPQGRYYEPLDLDHPDVLLGQGLDPSESKPQFHQQMVYAVAMKVIENFERALGREFWFRRRAPLLLLPHAFAGPNAYYDPKLHAVLFGYFRADARAPGRNLPGQTVFTCLSHDIIAHEVTHALLHRLKPCLLEPSNLDAPALHEGFADIVALFQHFSFRDALQETIQQQRTKLQERSVLVDLAQQFGHASGMGRALRSALDKPGRRLDAAVWECHTRGSILVAAVFDAFFTVYERRIRDLVRIATGGTGRLPEGDMHPDLVARIAGEANKTAQSILTMCLRALDYLPPVDATFGDYLRAMVTADQELIGVDTLDQRGALIEAFRLRGIYPEGVPSLAEESIVWEPAPPRLPRMPIVAQKLAELVDPSWQAPSPAARDELPVARQAVDFSGKQATALHDYASQNAALLRLDRQRPIQVRGFHFLFRVGQDGRPRHELVAQYVQTNPGLAKDLGGLPFRGGTTVVAAADGRVKYVIAKPIGGSGAAQTAASRRLERQRAFVETCALRDPLFGWHADVSRYQTQHMKARMNLARVHGGLYR